MLPANTYAADVQATTSPKSTSYPFANAKYFDLKQFFSENCWTSRYVYCILSGFVRTMKGGGLKMNEYVIRFNGGHNTPAYRIRAVSRFGAVKTLRQQLSEAERQALRGLKLTVTSVIARQMAA
jgi:hypothetical protein